MLDWLARFSSKQAVIMSWILCAVCEAKGKGTKVHSEHWSPKKTGVLCGYLRNDRAFSHTAPAVWNSLPLDIVSDLSCLATFKRLVKTELYNRAYLL